MTRKTVIYRGPREDMHGAPGYAERIRNDGNEWVFSSGRGTCVASEEELEFVGTSAFVSAEKAEEGRTKYAVEWPWEGFGLAAIAAVGVAYEHRGAGGAIMAAVAIVLFLAVWMLARRPSCR